MCAIFGLGFMKGHKITDTSMVRDIIRKLFIENQARGRTASGLAFVNSETIHVVKTNVYGGKLIDLPEYKEAEQKYMTFSTLPKGDKKGTATVYAKAPPISFIGHCRLKTKGTETNNVNNHPIVCGDVVGVHNGMISNDDRIFEIYTKVIERHGHVDSEVIFALINHFARNYKCSLSKSGDQHSFYKTIQRTSKSLNGSMACALVHRLQPYILWLYRRSNPCDIVLFRDVGMIAWSSAAMYIRTAIKGYEGALGKGEIVELGPNQGVSIDLFRNFIHRYKLPQYQEDAAAHCC
jgi:glucosamine 6-phosphate synthetase-like amidotransferase/phosphosugar isomerase protein